MSSIEDVRSAIESALCHAGFEVTGKSYRCEGQDAFVLIELQRWEVRQEIFFNVGIAIRALAERPISSVEQCHIFARLERLFPEARDTIMRASEYPRTHETATLGDLAQLAATCIGPGLRLMTSAVYLREALQARRFAKAMVTKEARAFLVDFKAAED